MLMGFIKCVKDMPVFLPLSIFIPEKIENYNFDLIKVLIQVSDKLNG